MLNPALNTEQSRGVIIRTRRITKIYHTGDVQVPALIDVDLEIQSGELVSVMGPSGSGKSTLMNILGLLDAPDSGAYFLDGEDVSKLSANTRADLRNKKVGFVFQGFNLLPRLSAMANVELPLIYAAVNTSKRKMEAEKSLKLVGLAEQLDRLPSQLSGGQQQRVAIARSIANQPEIILADEPTGNLDSTTSEEIISLFKSLCEDRKITIIIVTHDPEVANNTDRNILLRDGRIIDDLTLNHK